GSVKELIALAKSKPGELTYASAGSGTASHMAAELFKSMTNTRIIHVPYKGTGQSVTDLLAGRVSLTFDQMPALLPHIRSGKLKALAVGSKNRTPLLPEAPTV